MAPKSLFVVPLLLAVAALGCESAKDAADTQLAQIKVNLPPSPSFQKEHAPEKYADGTMSIYGLRKNMRKNFNKEFRVKAFMLEVYKCPHAKCKGKKCPKCQRKHFWLSDRASGPKNKAMMVTDYPKRDPQTRRKLKLHEGIQYIVSGYFARTSGTGFSASDGLMKYTGSEPVITD